ncbi:hypothetical protein H8E88_03475 [candidate division KSB1 bacterium]|nr:hypothetical protein [candidate division KSB1 bacterium]
MEKQYTAIVRKSKLEYVAVCLELNISARGEDLAEVEKNLSNAIRLYLDDLQEHPETVSTPIPTNELIEFFNDTEPEWYQKPPKNKLLRPYEVHEVPSYA